MNTESFYPFNPTKNAIMVKVDYYGFDRLEVIYKGELYELDFDEQYHYYKGIIDGIEGYIP